MRNKQKNTNIKKLKRTLYFKKYSIAIIWFLDKTYLLSLFSYLINLSLKVLKIQKKFNPHLNYYYYARIFKDAFQSQKVKQKTILFPSLIGSESSYNVRFMMVAKYMEQKGFSSQFVFCDGVFGLCTKERIFKTRTDSPLFCKECYKNYDYIGKKTGLPFEYLSSLTASFDNKEMNREIFEASKIATIDDCKKHKTTDKTPVGELAYKSVLRFFQMGELEDTDYELEIYKKFIQSAIKTYYIFDVYFTKQPIHTVVLWNGTLYFDAVISYICKKRGIPYITQESFIGSNSWIYKKNDVAIYLNFYNAWEKQAANNPLTSEKKEKTLKLFNQFKTGEASIVHYNDSHKGLILDKTFEYVAIFPNLSFDTYVLGRNPIFNSCNQFVVETINFWNSNVEGIKLIVRTHPAEVKLLTATTHFLSEIVTPILTDKIIFVDSTDDVSSYEILKHVKYTICYSSTIGVEAMLQGIPTVIAGESFYKPFAVSPKTKEEYFSTIKQLNQSISDITIDKEKLINYLHYLYFIRTKQLSGFDIDRKKGKISITGTSNYKELIAANQAILEEYAQEIINNTVSNG